MVRSRRFHWGRDAQMPIEAAQQAMIEGPLSDL